jgi:RHS repeat-associated protein
LKQRVLYANASSATILATFTWTHDAIGNVLTQAEEWPGSAQRAAGIRTTTNVYDDSNRLLTETVNDPATGITRTTYGYDHAHNRVSKTVTGGSEPGHWVYGYNAANQLHGWTKYTAVNGAVIKSAILVYDANGNRQTQTVTEGPNQAATTYQWDSQNRLSAVTRPDTTRWSYLYDYRTRRYGILRSGGAQASQYTGIAFAGGLSLGEYEYPGADTAQFLSTPAAKSVHYQRGPDMGGGVGGLLYSLRDGAPKFNLSNGRGDIVAQSDSSGALTWTASYEAYGKRTKETGTNADKQRANSKDEDPTELLNEGFRYRDIETGVWLSRDPAGFVDGPNLYAYVRQNPWTSFDPDGLRVDEKSRRDVDDKTGKWNPAAQLYKVTGDPKTGKVRKIIPISLSAKEVKNINAEIWINGMINNQDDAASLGLGHTGKSEFYMIHNPTNGGGSDLIEECAPQRLGFQSKVASTTRDILREFDLNSAHVTAHSQGTMILNKALRGLRDEKKNMVGMRLDYDGAAANVIGTKILAHQIGATIGRFEGHALDPVHNIIGMNTINPLRIAGSLIASPLLFKDRDTSPHSKRVALPLVFMVGSNHTPHTNKEGGISKHF